MEATEYRVAESEEQALHARAYVGFRDREEAEKAAASRPNGIDLNVYPVHSIVDSLACFESLIEDMKEDYETVFTSIEKQLPMWTITNVKKQLPMWTIVDSDGNLVVNNLSTNPYMFFSSEKEANQHLVMSPNSAFRVAEVTFTWAA